MCMRDIIIDLHRSDTLVGVRGGACTRITVMCYLKVGLSDYKLRSVTPLFV